MAKLITPAPDFFVQQGLEGDGSYVAQTTQKHNRPWLLFKLSEEDSIIIPNLSGTMLAQNQKYAVPTATGSGHLANAGFNISHALIVHSREHELLYDWEKLNPKETDRATELKAVSGDVKSKTLDFLKDFSKFSQDTMSAKYVDELPNQWPASSDFRTLSSASIQFRQDLIPKDLTYYGKKLPVVDEFDEYPVELRKNYSRKVTFTDPEEPDDKFNVAFTHVTPLQANTFDVFNSNRSPKANALTAVLDANFSNHYANKFDYLNRAPADIQEQWHTDKLKADANPNVSPDNEIVTASRKAKNPRKQAVSNDDDLTL